jgi:hypothetical protein
MRFALVLALVVGCQNRHEVEPVTAAEANDLAGKFAAAMLPCDEAKLAELIDGEAMAQRAEQAAHSREGKLAGMGLRDARTTAHFLCVGQASTEKYGLLHMKTVEGEPRPVMRRLARATLKPVVIVGYDELKLGKAGGKVRVVDIYSYAQGAWMTETSAAGMDAMTGADVDKALAFANTMKRARELAAQGKPGAALAALDELTRDYPDDPSLALMQIDGAFLRGDLDGALHAIDVLDQATGGDPFQDAVRAEVYLKRGKPGDV